MSTVAIIGGGISGLTCAYYLKTLGKSKIKYLFLLEKSPKFGGWIQTTRFPDGAVFEHGPRTIRVGSKAGYSALVLAEELALGSRILPITRNHDTAKTNMILANNELCPLPRDFFSLVRTRPPFTKPLILHAFREVTNQSKIPEDETVYSFIERRAGKEIADYVIDPMCRGIAAGDARELSVRSMFPPIYEAASKHGSIIKGMLKETTVSPAMEFMFSRLVQKAQKEIWRMWTLKTGITELIDALACTIEHKGVCDLIFNAECSKLTFEGGKAKVAVENENIEVDHIFSCVPSKQLSPLVDDYPLLADSLDSISAVDVAVVYLEYECVVLKQQGFGFLAPSFEDSKLLGVTFDSCCFPEQDGKSRTRVTCMLGGRWFKKIFGDTVSEDSLLRTATEEAGRILKIADKPVRSQVVLQRNCIPQYVVGHHKKLEKIDEEIKRNRLCLSLLGASYKGAGVPDCIYNTKLAVEKYLDSI